MTNIVSLRGISANLRRECPVTDLVWFSDPDAMSQISYSLTNDNISGVVTLIGTLILKCSPLVVMR